MSVPILILSDIQFHSYKAHSKIIDGVNSRLLQQMEAWRAAVRVGMEHGCGLMLIPGDVFEVRGSIKPSVFNRVTALVMDALSRGLSIAVIPGNHDMEHLDAGVSAVDSWDYLKAGSGDGAAVCRVFKVPGAWEAGGRKVLGIPYMNDVEAFKEVFARLSAAEKPDITMIHQGIDNFNWNGMYPFEGLTAEWLEENNPGIILSGHYHRPGRSTGGRVINVGALVQHRFSDEGSERGCWVLEDDDIRFFPIAGPRFITIAGSDHRIGSDRIGSDRIGSEYAGAFVRIRSKQAGEAEQLRKKAEAAGAVSVVVEIEKEFTTAHEKTITITSPRDMIREYLDMMPKYKPHKEDILELFNRICRP